VFVVFDLSRLVKGPTLHPVQWGAGDFFHRRLGSPSVIVVIYLIYGMFGKSLCT
jgi:hypothetical protein